MFYLSNRKLRLLIISLLLTIFAFFLGLLSPKAASITPTTLQYYKPDRTNNWTRPPVGWTNQGETLYATSVNTLNDIAGMYGVVNNQISGSYFVFQALLPPQDYWVVGQLQLVDGSIVSCDTKAHTSSNTDGDYYAFGCETTQGVQVYKYGIYLENQYGYAQTENAFSLSKLNGFENKGEYNSYLTTIQNNITSIQNSINDVQNKVSDIDTTIKDDNIDFHSTGSSISTWDGKNTTNGTITSLLVLPITLLQAIVNGVQTNCTSFNLGSLFNTSLILPCINLSSLLGSELFSVLDLLMSGFMILAISKKFIKIFNDFTNLRSNQVDELYGGGN